MLREDFKYISEFSCATNILNEECGSKFLSEASLNSLKRIIPDFVLTRSELLPVAFNACVVNMANLNDDVIDTSSGLDIKDRFVHNPINMEHDRTRVVGHVIYNSISEYHLEYKDGLGSEIIAEETVRASTSPFNISLAGVVYKVCDPKLVKVLSEASNPLSDSYLTISTSWELGFNEYHILVGSPLISEGEVWSEPSQVEIYSKYLKAYGGNGKLPDGRRVYRLITGSIFPLGVALTTNPAAAVKGVVVGEFQEKKLETEKEGNSSEGEESKETQSTEVQENIEEISAAAIKDAIRLNAELNKPKKLTKSQINEFFENNYSQNKNNLVKKYSIMNIETITDEQFKELSVANVRMYLANEIDKVSTEFSKKLEAKEKEAKAEQEKAEKAKADMDEIQKSLDSVKAELVKEQEIRANEKATNDFNSRMEDISQRFELDEKVSKIVANKIRGLNDESYSSWLEEFETLYAAKKKEAMCSKEKEGSKEDDVEDEKEKDGEKKGFVPFKKGAKASVEDVVEDALDDLKDKKGGIANGATFDERRAVWEEAFKVEDIVKGFKKS